MTRLAGSWRESDPVTNSQLAQNVHSGEKRKGCLKSPQSLTVMQELAGYIFS